MRLYSGRSDGSRRDERCGDVVVTLYAVDSLAVSQQGAPLGEVDAADFASQPIPAVDGFVFFENAALGVDFPCTMR